MNLNGKTILVSGSSGGIGAALCRLLHEKGARLIMAGHEQASLQNQLEELGDQHHVVCADIGTAAGRAAIVQRCRASGALDGVVNLAGILEFSLFEQQSEASIERILNINLTGCMLLCHDLIGELRSRPEAVLLNVGSTFGSIGYPGFATYCASKAGIRCFTEALSRELADTGIRVSYVAPRATSTALNSDRVNALNKALGNKSDSPEYVAARLIEVLERGQKSRYLGWPERFFVRLNALLPAMVHRALVRQLSVIKRYASE